MCFVCKRAHVRIYAPSDVRMLSKFNCLHLVEMQMCVCLSVCVCVCACVRVCMYVGTDQECNGCAANAAILMSVMLAAHVCVFVCLPWDSLCLMMCAFY